MKRTLLAALSFLALLWGLNASAASYESDLGYRIDLPSGWTIVSRAGVKEKPEMVQAVFEAAEKNRTLTDMPEALYNKLKEMIAGGDVEYYYKTDVAGFSISVYQDNGSIPVSPDTAQETCRSLSEDLTKLSKNPAPNVYECRLANLGSIPALYIVADAYERGERYVQYMIQKAPNQVLLFTATSTGKQDVDKMKSDFDAIMKSFRKM